MYLTIDGLARAAVTSLVRFARHGPSVVGRQLCKLPLSIFRGPPESEDEVGLPGYQVGFRTVVFPHSANDLERNPQADMLKVAIVPHDVFE